MNSKAVSPRCWSRLTAGHSVLIPGERFNATIVRYLKFARDFNARFPGFETDIHGLVKGEDGRYHVDCVRD